VLDAAVEVGPQPFDGARRFDIAQAPDDLFEHHPHLEAREAGADTEVAAMAEGQVIVGRALDISIGAPFSTSASIRFGRSNAASRSANDHSATCSRAGAPPSGQRRRSNDRRAIVPGNIRLPLALHRIRDDRCEALRLLLRVKLFAFFELAEDFGAEQVERTADVLMLVFAGLRNEHHLIDADIFVLAQLRTDLGDVSMEVGT